MTPISVRTFPHGVNTNNGGGLSSVGAGTPTYSSSLGRSGPCMIIAPAGAALYKGCDYSGSQNDTNGAFYFKFISSLPAADAMLWYGSGSVSNADFWYMNAANQFMIGFNTGASATQYLTTLTPVADRWYLFQWRITWNTNPHIFKARIIDDVTGTVYSFTDSSYALAGETSNGWRWGTNQSHTYTMRVCDTMDSITSGDYPLGGGGYYVRTLKGVSDGTHSGTALKDQAGNTIDGSSITAYNLINEFPVEVTTYIKQTATGTTSYAEVNLTDLDANDTPIALMGTVGYTAATTSTDQMATGVMDGSTFREIRGNPTTRADYSDGVITNNTTIYYTSAMIALTALDRASVNALVLRTGYSNDVSPNPYLVVGYLECAVQVSSGVVGPLLDGRLVKHGILNGRLVGRS